MKTLLFTMVLLSSFISSYSLAHSSHGHMNDNAAISVVIKSAKQMTFKDFGYAVGQLPESWKNITVADVTVFSVTGGVYIVSATNAEDKKTLYFQIADDGEVMAVSESSTFK
tara:strand:- start:127 stop:462 length:336 start_codon:yes stop_codon:yes gene_type:complete